MGKVTIAVPQHFPRPGWVEHDPAEIWKTVERACSLVLKKSGISPRKILALGITNQRETVSLFQGSKPLHRFIVWQDRRTQDFCDQTLKPHAERILQISGTPVDPYFSGSKIRWLLDKLNPSRRQDLRFATIDSYLVSKICGVEITEATNASRTSLMDLRSLKWSDELLEIYGVPKSLCPRIIPSQNSELRTKGLSFLPDGIPVSGIAGDQQAALFGQMAWGPGEGKITYGTGSFILLNTGRHPQISKNKLVSTLALQRSNGEATYALEGSVFICGAWIQWLRDQLKLIKSSSDSERLALKVKSSEGVLIFPALTGMGAPFWNPRMRGSIMGLSRGTGREHLARASLEALAFQNKALIEAMSEDAELRECEWRVDGGAVSNDLLLQIQADVLRTPLYRPKNLEATATGAALLAALESKLIDETTVRKSWGLNSIFKPSKNSDQTNLLYQQWRRSLDTLATHSL